MGKKVGNWGGFAPVTRSRVSPATSFAGAYYEFCEIPENIDFLEVKEI